jgi:hypothetical protein
MWYILVPSAVIIAMVILSWKFGYSNGWTHGYNEGTSETKYFIYRELQLTNMENDRAQKVESQNREEGGEK